MRSFLEFVATKLLGRPVAGSCWRCPFCDSNRPSFSVRPPKGNYPIKYHCFRCGAWGDEFDLAKLFFPEESFPARRRRVAEWRLEHEQGNTALSLSPGIGEAAAKSPGNVDLAWANLTAELREMEFTDAAALQVLQIARKHAKRNGCTVEELTGYWLNLDEWVAESDARHLEACDDPDCEAIVCRAARGLPPLTPEELFSGRN